MAKAWSPRHGAQPQHASVNANVLVKLMIGVCLFVSCAVLLSYVLVGATGAGHQRPPNYKHIVKQLPPAPDSCSLELRRKIAWGAATSAYQIEGAWDEGGKAPSIWDTFAHLPNKVANNDTGDVACDHYRRYRADVSLMRRLGLKYYRLSLSWPRLLPGGGRGSAPNPSGVAFYKALLRELVQAGITPVVTLFHWDLPQSLQDGYEGFLDPQIAEDFAYYADMAFRELGPWVKHWLTFNEPLSICQLGYGLGVFAPGMQGGSHKTYRCGHHLLLAHSLAVQLYREKYAPVQQGRISMALSAHWGIPLNASSPADVAAAGTYVEWQLGWMADPLFTGQYPPSMRAALGSKLPSFLPTQAALINGSLDFFALNFYTAHFIGAAKPDADHSQAWVEVLDDAEGNPPGEPSDVFWLFKTPEALRHMLTWVAKRYRGPEIWITENGVCSPGESSAPVEQARLDLWRLHFFRDYLEHACKAVAEDGVNLAAYFAWSLMDNFEWNSGFGPRFGITHIDYTNGLIRSPKLSAYWLSEHFFQEAPEQPACLSAARALASTTVNGGAFAAQRSFASSAASGSGGSKVPLLLGLAAIGGGVYYADQAGYISLKGVPGVPATVAKRDYAAVKAAIEDVLDADGYDDGSYGPVLVRLAWHASGTFDKASGTGGSNGGTMRFAPESEHGANAGLSVAREVLEPIKKKFPWISYADLWTLAGATAIEAMGGPHINWRPGREDKPDGSSCPPDGRLPDASLGAAHVRDVFGRMGFTDQEAVALIGAHCIGRCHTDRSGFKGPWTNAPTTFSNLYFVELKDNKWRKKKWDGPLQYADPTGELMMLPADMALLWDRGLRKYVEAYAKDSDKFFDDFAVAFAKLLELGVPIPESAPVL